MTLANSTSIPELEKMPQLKQSKKAYVDIYSQDENKGFKRRE